MHDPAGLDTILTLVSGAILAILAVAVFGGIYLIRKYGPTVVRKTPLDRLFVPPHERVDHRLAP